MMRRVLISAFLFLALAFSARAQVDLEAEFFSLPDSVTNEYLDSLTVEKVKPNNYWMIGVYGGTSVQFGMFNPSRLVYWQLTYPMYGFSIVGYYTMFGIFPNMGVEFGAQRNYEGYEFKPNKENGYRSTESGAYKVVMDVPEAFFLTHFHFDIGEHFKMMAKIGIYGGYRMNIKRTLDEAYADYDTYQQYVNTFRDYDRRLTYGVQGGFGMGLMLSPFELHLNVQVKWGWESFWNPDYASPYYYRFGYPLDGAVTLGLYYQLTPRYGHTRGQLKKLAKKMVQEQSERNE